MIKKMFHDNPSRYGLLTRTKTAHFDPLPDSPMLHTNMEALAVGNFSITHR